MTRLEKLRAYSCGASDFALAMNDPCSLEIDVHHQTGGGMALKSSDERAFPLCHKHHMDFHAARGVFRDWDKARRRAWQDRLVETYTRILCDPEAF
jgi:hypothetical protein